MTTHPPTPVSPLRNGLSAIHRALTSRRSAVALLILLATMCLLGVVVPQQGSMRLAAWQASHPALAGATAWAGLDNVFSSPLFLALLAMTGLCVALSIAKRLSGLRGPKKRPLPLAGSLLFHAGLLGVLIAATVSAIGHSEQRVTLTEGQTITLGPQHSGGAFEVRLERFHPIHEGRWGTPDYSSDLILTENGRETKRSDIGINRPLKHGGLILYPRIHGFSPLVTLSDEEDVTRFSSFVALQTDLKAEPVRYRDDFSASGTGLTIEAELFPDAYMEGNRLASRSPNPTNAALSVTMRNGVDTIYTGTVYLGETVDTGAGLRLEFEGLRYWAGFDVVRDPGATALFVSAWIAVAGLCLRFATRRPSHSMPKGTTLS